MLSFATLTSLALSFSLVIATPQCYADSCHGIPQPTCTASYITTIDIQSVTVTTYMTVPVTTYDLSTVTTVATIPYSCYTYLEPTPVSSGAYCGTFDPSTCTKPVPMCIELQTVTVPCYDPCCPTTATVKTEGACASCRTGCATSTVLVTSSNCPAQLTY